MGRLLSLCLTLAAEALLLAALVIASQPDGISETEWPEASDRRLLSASQMEEIREHDRCAIVFDGQSYVYEDGASYTLRDYMGDYS